MPLIPLQYLPVLAASHGHVNFLAIPVGVIAAFVLGGLWYSPLLFAPAWQRHIGKSRAELGSPVRGMIVSMVSLLLKAVGMFMLAGQIDIDGCLDGALLGLAIGAVFVAPALATIYTYGGRGFTLWLIDSGYQVAALMAIGAIIGAWHA